METTYVERLDGGYRLSGTRVSLDSIVHAFWRGEAAESIAQAFPSVSLEQVYGALAFYLAHRTEVDANLAQADAEFAALRDEAKRRDPAFFQRLVDSVKPDFLRLAREQGVQPVGRLEDLMGGWPVEERDDGFEEALLKWRSLQGRS